MEKHRRRKQNKPTGARYATFLIVVALLVLQISMVRALEFDNVKDYDSDTKTLIITNAFGLGETLAELQLISPLDVRVGAGYQKVAEFTLDNFKSDYGNAFQDMNFYDMKVGGEEITREFDYKYLTTEQVQVSEYETVCTEKNGVNGTYQDCAQEEIGWHWETQPKWEKFSDINELPPNEKVTIGIFTTVLIGDYIDWVPIFMGETISEWATWTADLNTNLNLYYNCDDYDESISHSLNFTNNEGSMNFTTTGALIGSSCRFTTDNNMALASSSLTNIRGSDGTINIWIKVDDVNGTTDRIWTNNDDENDNFDVHNAGYVYINGYESGLTSTSIYPTNNTWMMITIVHNSTGAFIFSNGTLMESGTMQTTYTGDEGLIFGATTGGTLDFAGYIDELGYWSRPLTQTEITQLYNDGVGMTYTNVFDNAPNITLTSPSNSSETTDQNININFTAWDDINLTSVKLYVNDVLNQTNSTGTNNSVYSFPLALGNGDYTIYGRVTDNASVSTNSSSIQINIDTLHPSITSTTPTGVVDYINNSDNVTLNATFTDTRLDSCWYNYNGTNITITGCITAVENSTVFILETNNTNMTLWANDTYGNYNSTFIDWSYKIINNSNTFNATALTTSAQVFSTNVTANATLTAVQLDYNGTNYSLTNQGSGIWNATVQIPIANVGANTLKYYYTYGTETILSTNFTQTNTALVVTQCNATYTDIFANFTFVNENNETAIVGSFPSANLTYHIGDGTIIKTTIISNSTEGLVYNLCSNAGYTNVSVDTRIQYESTGYPQRVSNPSAQNWSNESITNKNLYLLPTADGIYVTFQVQNSAEQLVSGVAVNATRLVGSSQELVGEGITDSSGGVTMWLNPNFVHAFVFSKTGYTSLATSFAPTQTSYTVTLGASSSAAAAADYTRGITYNVTPLVHSPLYEGQIYPFGFLPASSYWTITEFGFRLANSTNSSLISGVKYTNGGNVTSYFNVTGQTNLVLHYYWKINSTYSNASVIYYVTATDGTDWSINNTITDLNAYIDDGLFGLDDFGLSIIIFIIMITSVGIMSYKFGLTSPLAVSAMIFGVVLFLDVGLNLLDNINPFAIDHFITVFTGLLMITALFREWLR